MPFEKDNKLAVDRPNAGEGKDKSTKQKEKEAFDLNRLRIKEYMDDLWDDMRDKKLLYSQRVDAGKQWKDAMKNLAPLVEKTDKQAQITISDSELTKIATKVQKIYLELNAPK